MPLNRRQFLNLTAAGIAAGTLGSMSPAAAKPKIKALAFDAFPIFDPRPIFALAERLFPGRGAELSAAWRTRQFEYQWLRALSQQYADFGQVTEESLVFAAEILKLELTTDKRRQLMNAYLELEPWPEVPAALQALKGRGLRLAFLSNATARILNAGIKNAGLEHLFEHVLSTDKIKTYKPDPRAYRMGMEAFGLKKAEILFVAFAGWDAAGAKSFGYPAFWVNRMGLPMEQLGASPDAIGKDLSDLTAYIETLG